MAKNLSDLIDQIERKLKKEESFDLGSTTGMGAEIAKLGGSAAKGILQFNKSAAGGGGLGQLMQGTQSAAGNIAGAVTANPYVQLGLAAVNAVSNIKEWTNNLHESNRGFAEFSGSMAAVIAQSDVRRIQMEQEQGERRARSAQELAEARDRLDRQTAPIEDWWANLKNRLGANFNANMANLLQKFGPEMQDEEDVDEKVQGMGHLWMRSIVDEERQIQARRPQRLQ